MAFNRPPMVLPKRLARSSVTSPRTSANGTSEKKFCSHRKHYQRPTRCLHQADQKWPIYKFFFCFFFECMPCGNCVVNKCLVASAAKSYTSATIHRCPCRAIMCHTRAAAAWRGITA